MFSFLTDWHSIICQFSSVWLINLLSILKVNMPPPDMEINFVSHYVSTKFPQSSEWMHHFVSHHSQWNLSLCRSRKTAPFAHQTSLVLTCHMTIDGACTWQQTQTLIWNYETYFWHSSRAKTWGWSSSDMVTTACLAKAPCRLWSTVYLLMLEVVELVQ